MECLAVDGEDVLSNDKQPPVVIPQPGWYRNFVREMNVFYVCVPWVSRISDGIIE